MLQRHRYLELLSREYDNRYAVYTKLINLNTVLSMPKGKSILFLIFMANMKLLNIS